MAKQMVNGLQVNVLQDGKLRVIEEDIDIALEKIIPGETWEIDEVEDGAGIGFLVNRVENDEWVSFKVTDDQISALQQQIQNDTQGTVEIITL